MKGKVYRGGSLLLGSPGPFFPIRSPIDSYTFTVRVEKWRPMRTNSPRYCYLRLFISPPTVSPVGLCPLYFHADDSCRPAFVMHDTMHFYFHFTTRRNANLAPLSMIRSSKVIQYSRNVAAQSPSIRGSSSSKILFLPFLFLQRRRGDQWKKTLDRFLLDFSPFFFIL